MSTPDVLIYTDGSSRGNPGPGGYGAILLSGKRRKELSKGFRLTTNNRMELLAVIAALEVLKKNNLHIAIYSDSKYVVDAVTKGWLQKWIFTNFKGGKKNRDLWKQFYLLSQKNKIKFHWVKGHATNLYNNQCDVLATQAAASSSLLKDEVYENSEERGDVT